MSTCRSALLVIDAQQSFEHRPFWSRSDTPAFFEHLQSLIDGAKRREIPIVQIFHVEDTGVFSLASGYVKALTALSIVPDVVIHKNRHSALVGSSLPVWLVEHGIRRLMVSGIRTEQCCETTTRHASDCGYEIDFISEATMTFAMTDSNGRSCSAETIKERTELVLDGRFARVLTVEQSLSAADRAAREAEDRRT
jgi:nicotinamidase-related amidase